MLEAARIKACSPPRPRTNQKSSGTPRERFNRMVAVGSSDCWYWIGSVDALGYGRFLALGENRAHRASYRLFKGDIPNGKFVMHTCDTRCCVNPDHLILGTQADNVKDMVQKGRNRTVKLCGERNPMSKLTAENVAEIRRRVAHGEKQKSMCAIFNVSPMTISRVVRGELWQ